MIYIVDSNKTQPHYYVSTIHYSLALFFLEVASNMKLSFNTKITQSMCTKQPEPDHILGFGMEYTFIRVDMVGTNHDKVLTQ